MKTQAQYDRIDKILGAVLGIVASVVLALLVMDVQLFVHEPARIARGEAVARISAVTSQVRRKPRDVPLWDAAGAEEALYTRDSVFTDAGASATVTFEGGTSIELGESTLVAIEKTEASPVVDVIRGTLRVAAADGVGKSVELRIGGETTTIRMDAKATLAVTVAKGKPAAVAVLSGRAEIGASRTAVTAGQVATVEHAAAPPKIVEAAVRLKSPGHGAKVVRNDGEGVAFGYEIKGSVGQLDIARDEGFRRLVASWSVIAPRFVAPGEGLAAGTYYWRLRAGTETSEVRRLEVVVRSERGPEPLAPAQGARIASDEATVRLQWSAAESASASGYWVEWAQDAAFTRGVKGTKATVASATASGLAAARYHWRVQVLGGAWGATGTFEVVAPFVAAAAPAPAPASLPASSASSAPSAPLAATFPDPAPAALATAEPAPEPAPIVPQTPALPEPTPEPLAVAATGEPLTPTPAFNAAPSVPPAPAPPAPTVPSSRAAAKPAANVAVAPSAPAPIAPTSKAAAKPTAEASVPPSAPSPPRAPRALRLAPHRVPLSLFAGFSPTQLRYKATTDDPQTSVSALLFNSWRAGAELWLLPRTGVDASLLRTSTILFRTRREGDPEGQKPLLIQPFSLAVAARYRLALDEHTYADLRAGLDADNVVRFRRATGGTLSVRHMLVYGPLLGVEFGGLPLGDLLLVKLGAAYVFGLGSARGEVERSSIVLLDAAAELTLSDSPWSLELGYESRRQRFSTATGPDGAPPAAVGVDAQSGLLQLRWRDR